MHTIHITVASKVATYSARDGAIVCGNDDYQVQFVLDSEWDGLAAKARFRWNGKHQDVSIVDGLAAVPRISNAIEVQVGVYSDDGTLCTTTPARVPCEKSILCTETEPTEGNEAYYASEAQEAAQRAEEAADRAEAAGGTGGGTVIDPESVNQAQEAAQAAQAAQAAAEAARDAADTSAQEAAERVVEAYEHEVEAGRSATSAQAAQAAAETAQAAAEDAADRAEAAASSSGGSSSGSCNVLTAESESWLSSNGDPEKVYIVLNEDGEGGMLYAATVEEGSGEPVNMLDEVGIVTGRGLSNSGALTSNANACTTGFIPVAPGDTVTVKNWQAYSSSTMNLCLYDAEENYLMRFWIAQNNANGVSTANTWCTPIDEVEGLGYTGFQFTVDADSLGVTSETGLANLAKVAYFRFSFGAANGDNAFGDEAVYITPEAYVEPVPVTSWHPLNSIAEMVNAMALQIVTQADQITSLSELLAATAAKVAALEAAQSAS